MVQLKKNRSGFTIVELLIVIVVIGILAGLVIVQFTNVQKKARDTERKSDIRNIESELAEYYALNGYYPGATSDLTIPAESLAGPSTGETYTYSPTATGGGACTTAGANCTSFTISTSNMEAEGNPYTVSSN